MVSVHRQVLRCTIFYPYQHILLLIQAAKMVSYHTSLMIRLCNSTILYYSTCGAFSNIEILTIPKYTINRFISRMNLAKQRLNFCVRYKLSMFVVSFAVKHWSKCKLVYLLLCFMEAGNSALLSVVF